MTQDSRAAGPGVVFVAVPGLHTDGHAHAAGAVAAGAVAVVAERPLPELGVPVIVVPDTRAALAPLAARLAGDPSRQLVVAGVTGTDGKTTTTTLLHAAWRGAGITAAALTTVDFRVGDTVEVNSTRQTTLDAPELQGRLAAALAAGCTHVALETSSHALVLNRVDAVDFRIAVVLRITSEHLDLHGDRDSYIAAKAGLVERVAEHPDGVAILDGDDDAVLRRLTAIPVARRLVLTTEGRPGAELAAEDVDATAEGVAFTARTPWGHARVRLPLAGAFNAGNALAAVAAACAGGATFEGAVAGVEALPWVRGRMERTVSPDGVVVVIDYAHTADALDRVLAELRPATRGRLWVVFGSAGERDRPKRPEMGSVAARRADLIVLTDEDPRGEDGNAILEAIATGARAAGAGPDRLRLIADRTEAIRSAIRDAAPGDTVLCAGKGHESTLIGPAGPAPWDERATVEAALAARQSGRREGTPTRRG